MCFSSSRFFFLSRNVNNQSCVIFEEKLGWNWNKKIVRSNKTERIRIRKYLYDNISSSKEEFIYLSRLREWYKRKYGAWREMHTSHAPTFASRRKYSLIYSYRLPREHSLLTKINRRALRYLLFLLRNVRRTLEIRYVTRYKSWPNDSSI